MSIFGRSGFIGVMLVALVAANGCSPSDSGQMDDEKEPHYVLGKSRVNAMDYSGAVEAFSDALEVNPRSAAAHFQLGILYEDKVPDAAAAIYHYERYLKLAPDAGNAPIIKQRIDACKHQLASDINTLPSSPAAQKQLEDLAEKNRQLQAEVERLNGVVKQWSAYVVQQQSSTANIAAPGSSGNMGGAIPDDVTSGGALAAGTASARTSTPPAPATKPLTHTIAKGDTLASVARKYNVSLTALQKANQGISPTKLRVGQVVNLPAQ